MTDVHSYNLYTQQVLFSNHINCQNDITPKLIRDRGRKSDISMSHGPVILLYNFVKSLVKYLTCPDFMLYYE